MSNPMARRLSPNLARFPNTPEKSFDRNASRNSCVIDKSPPEKSLEINLVRTEFYQENIMNRPSTGRLSFEIQDSLTIS
jgi:hypothetical protein